VAVGPRVPLGEAGASLRLAQRAIALVRQGVILDAPVVHCTDHLLTLWLLGDEFVMRQLNDHSLAPLSHLTAKQRARLTETLLLWLQLRGSAPELADKLGVHPQTIRYRMNQLERILGDRLRDPDERLTLEIALRAENLLRQEKAADN
jgi:DNA-binding PucR family transcriptional regulator